MELLTKSLRTGIRQEHTDQHVETLQNLQQIP